MISQPVKSLNLQELMKHKTMAEEVDKTKLGHPRDLHKIRPLIKKY